MLFEQYKEIDKMKAYHYVNTPLYYYNHTNKSHVLYKQKGNKLHWDKILTSAVPDKLYIHKADLQISTNELFESLSKKLDVELDKEYPFRERVVEVVEEIIENMFLEVDNDSVSFAPVVIKKITKNFFHEPSVFKEFAKYVKSNDVLVHHSLRVLFFVLTYCYYNRMNLEDIERFGLAGLFHAIGKTKLNQNLITKRVLTDEEFEEYKMFPQYSFDILSNSTHPDVRVTSDIVLKHKENRNKTGFPYGIKLNNDLIEAIGIIESYEQLTSVKRKTLSSYEALKIIRRDVESGKYNKEVFKKFVLCLGTDFNLE